MNEICACTIISKNYLSFARVFTDSYLQHYPEGHIFVLLVDEIEGCFDPSAEKFTLVNLGTLNIPDLDKLCFKYNILELNTAVKPFFLSYILRNYKFKKVVYFDPDIQIFEKLNKLPDLLDNYSIVLTPHITKPIDDFEREPNETHFLKAGVYNLGFIAVAKTKTTDDFLSWWQKRLTEFCLNRPDLGYFLDQKWINLVPCYFHEVFVLREPGYNVAYWNLCHRIISKNAQDRYQVQGEPLYFYHFSGFEPERPHILDKYYRQVTFEGQEFLREIYNKYVRLNYENGYAQSIRWPYFYATFDNGVKISDIIRRVYQTLGNRVRHFGNPFYTQGNSSLISWLNRKKKDHSTGAYLTNLQYEIYRLLPDTIRILFPDLIGKNFELYAKWLLSEGREIYKLDPFFLNTLNPILKGKPLKQGFRIKKNILLQKLPLSPMAIKIEKWMKRWMGEDAVHGVKSFLKKIIGKER